MLGAEAFTCFCEGYNGKIGLVDLSSNPLMLERDNIKALITLIEKQQGKILKLNLCGLTSELT